MRILFILALLLPVAAQAQPYLAQVINVAPDDALNVRRGPSAGTEDIGDLINGTRLEITGLDASGKWARINWSERDGWIARRYTREIPRPRDPESGMPVDLFCAGTEPFWSADILPGRLFSFMAMGDESVRYMSVAHATRSVNYTIDYAFATIGNTMTGVLHQMECSDGMSDITYAWSLDLIDRRGGSFTLLTGCCSTILQGGY